MLDPKIKIERLKAYIKYGIDKAYEENREHGDVCQVLQAFFHTQDMDGRKFPCGTIGCALGSFALSDAGKADGWKIKYNPHVCYGGEPVPFSPFFKRWNTGAMTTGLEKYLDVGELLAGIFIGEDPKTRSIPHDSDEVEEQLDTMRYIALRLIEQEKAKIRWAKSAVRKYMKEQSNGV